MQLCFADNSDFSKGVTSNDTFVDDDGYRELTEDEQAIFDGFDWFCGDWSQDQDDDVNVVLICLSDVCKEK